MSDVDVPAALVAGLAGGVVMAVVVAVPALAGRELALDVRRFWARFLGERPGRAGWSAAALGHLALSAVVGLGYAAAGAIVAGGVHLAVAMVVIVAVARDRLDSTTVAVAIVAHLAYALTTASVYGALDG